MNRKELMEASEVMAYYAEHPDVTVYYRPIKSSTDSWFPLHEPAFDWSKNLYKLMAYKPYDSETNMIMPGKVIIEKCTGVEYEVTAVAFACRDKNDFSLVYSLYRKSNYERGPTFQVTAEELMEQYTDVFKHTLGSVCKLGGFE